MIFKPPYHRPPRYIKANTYHTPPYQELDLSTDSNGDGGEYICFACGESIKTGTPFICVSRILKKGEGPAIDKDRVVAAMASLQVCMKCVEKAVNRGGVDWRWHTRAKLHDVEKHGFFLYACFIHRLPDLFKSDTYVAKEFLTQDLLMHIDSKALECLLIRRPDQRGFSKSGGENLGRNIVCYDAGFCLNCLKEIDSNELYLEIEIAINKPTRRNMAISNAFLMAKFCDICSKELFPVSDDGFTTYDIFNK